MTSDLEDFVKNNPGTPLDEFIEEAVPVKKFQYDPDSKTATHLTVMETRKTKFIHAPYEKVRCPDGEHFFAVVEPRKGIFACSKCPLKTKVFPTTHRFENGALINLRTGKPV